MTIGKAKDNSCVSIILASFLVFLIATVFSVGSLSLFFRLPLTPLHFPVEVLLSSLFTILIFKNQRLSNRLLAISLGVGLIILSMGIFSNTFDYSYDAVAYHKLAIGHLAHGWTPPSETVSEFSRTSSLDLAAESQAIWLEHYAEGPWIFSASIYALTNSIESSKILTIILIISLFLYLKTKLNSLGFSKFNSIMLSTFVALSPAALTQIFTFYVDGALAVSLYFVCLSLVFFLKSNSNSSHDILIYFASVIICCNVKFTGIPFALLFSCLIIAGYLLANYFKNNTFFDAKINLKNIFYITGIFLFAISVVGGPVYINNTLDHGNPFYPLMGKNKTDIISPFQPKSFSHMNPYKKFTLAFFSHTGNETHEKFRLKIPGTFNFTLAELAPGCGSRAGFGFLFSLITILSLIGIAFSFKNMGIFAQSMIILFIVGCIILTGIMDGSWMARYTPYIYAIPLIALYVTISEKNNILSNLLIIALCLNLLTFAIHPMYSLVTGYQVKREISSLKSDQPLHICLNDRYFTSVVYTLHDSNIKYLWKKSLPDKQYIERLSLYVNSSKN